MTIRNSFVRAVKALALAGGNPHAATVQLEAAGDHAAGEVVKAAVTPALTTGAGWASPIALAAGNEFFDRAAERSVYGAAGFLRIPLNTRLTGIGTDVSAAFVAQGAPAPVAAGAFSSAGLPPLTVVATSIVSKELLKTGDPAAEPLIASILTRAVANAIDSKLLGDAAAVSDVSPAGLLNGLTPITATSDAREDIRDLVDDFDGSLEDAVFVCAPKVGAALNDSSRPLAGIRNGELLNAPLFCTRNAKPATLAILDPTGIALGWSGFEVSIATDASLAMSDGPSSPAAQVSLWQGGLVGIRITRHINWAIVRPGSVSYVSGVAW